MKDDTTFHKDCLACIAFDDDMVEADKSIGNFLYERIINCNQAQVMDGKSTYLIRHLFKAFVTNPQQLPDRTVVLLINRYAENNHEDLLDNESDASKVAEARLSLKKLHAKHDDEVYKRTLLRTLTDYVAGMTDSHALRQFESLYGGSSHV